MAAGGHDAQLTVKDLKTNEVLTNTSIGGYINNACHIGCHRNGDILLFTSNNDNTIKVFNVGSTISQMAVVQHCVAVNYTSTSPDGKYVASVGDNSFVTLYEMRDSRTFIPIAKMNDFCDAGFSCCFDANSMQLAASSQDGYVVVWDIRKTSTPLAKLQSKQKHTKGAARCVRFSPVPCVDLLVYSEHESYIHVVDTRTYQDEQIVNVVNENVENNSLDVNGIFGSLSSSGTSSGNLFSSSPSCSRDISGLSFSADCRKLFVGMIDQIQEYTIDMTSR
jgi:WD40 repeat protein